MTELTAEPTATPMTEPSTPLMRQYAAVKKEHPTALLFFRLGDFYELFFDDAIVAAKELQITLTSRNKEKGIAVPMCGVPYHAAEGYIGKLIRKGFKVAICEQMEAPSQAKKLVRREVTRVMTPGTAADSSLGSDENNFLAALATVTDRTGELRVGFAALDLSTGEFRATEFSGEGAMRRVQEELEQLRPKELLYGSAAPLFESRSGGGSLELCSARANRPCPHGLCSRRRLGLRRELALRLLLTTGFLRRIMRCPCWRIILECCRWKGSGWRDGRRPPRLRARFFITCGRRSADRSITWTASAGTSGRAAWCWTRSRCAIWSLTEPLFAGTDAGVTLLRSMDAAVTPMGKRLLRAWMLRPSLDLGEIHARLDAVEAGVKETVAREELRRALDGVLDLERLLSRVTLETANPRDVLALAASLAKIPASRRHWPLAAERLRTLHSSLDDLGPMCASALRRRSCRSRR
jgi:DNA mismatch repair protein MutS